MEHRTRQRWILVGAVSAVQLVCLFAALLVFDAWVTNLLRDTVRRRVIVATEQTAIHIAAMIDLLEIDDITPQSDGWSKLQQVVEQSRLPNRGYLCVIDASDGRMICHPELTSKPELAEMKLGHVVGRDAATTGEPLILDDPQGGSEIITVRDLAGLNAKLLVHHSENETNAVIAAFVSRVRTIGGIVAVMLVLLTSLATMLIIRRYERRLNRANERLTDANDKLGIANMALADVNINLEQQVADRTAEVLRGRDAVVYGMAKLAESRDDETGQHLERICKYVEILATRFAADHNDLDGAWVKRITSTAALHDIGKVGVPDAVLRKPGALTDDERKIIQRHTYIGGDALIELKKRWGENGNGVDHHEDPFLTTAAQIAIAHHEKWDGSGYPYGLRGDDIPLEARIVALADVYDALTSKRIYKDALSHDEASRLIRDGRGTHFDPDLVEIFESLRSEFERIAEDWRDDHIEEAR